MGSMEMTKTGVASVAATAKRSPHLRASDRCISPESAWAAHAHNIKIDI